MTTRDDAVGSQRNHVTNLLNTLFGAALVAEIANNTSQPACAASPSASATLPA